MPILTQKAFADLIDKTPQHVSRDVRKGKLPVTDLRQVNTDDKRVAAYIEKLGYHVTPVPRSSRGGGRHPNRTTPAGEHSRNDLEMKKLAADAQYRELKNAQMEGRLVARESMIRCVWNPLETFLTRLLADGAKTIAAKVFPIGKSGGTIEEAEVEVRKQLSTLIKPLIRAVKRALRIEDDV